MWKLFTVLAIFYVSNTFAADKLTVIEDAPNAAAVAQYNRAIDALNNADYERAAKFLELAAKKNLAAAQYQLSLLYVEGQGVDTDERRASQLLQLAARAGWAEAQFHLGKMYLEGKLVPEDPTAAIAWFEEAAKQGIDAAEREIFVVRRHLQRNYTDDFHRTVELAQEEDNFRAHYKLGLMFYDGIGIARSIPQAAEWLEKAAKGGIADAQSRIGLFYAQGRGVEQDWQQARYWFEAAAALGETPAMAMLGTIYRDGNGIEADAVKAMQWFLLASHHGNMAAHRSLQKLLPTLTPEQRKLAQQHALTWLMQHTG